MVEWKQILLADLQFYKQKSTELLCSIAVFTIDLRQCYGVHDLTMSPSLSQILIHLIKYNIIKYNMIKYSY